MKKTAIFAVAAVAAALMLAGCGKDIVPNTVATVNGEAITGEKYFTTMEKFAGENVLRNLVEQAFYMQFAKDEGVAPAETQVAKQLEMLKEQPGFDDQLKVLGEDFVKEQLYAQQAQMNLAKKFIKCTEDELKSAYEMQKTLYVHGPRQQISAIIGTDKDKLQEAKVAAEEGKTFDELAKEYLDPMFGTTPYKFTAEDGNIQTPLSDEAKKEIKSLKSGKVSKVVNISPEGQPAQFAIFTITKEIPASNKKLEDVKDEVTSMVAMQKSQSDPDYQKKVSEKKKAAKIDIKVEAFKSIADSYTDTND